MIIVPVFYVLVEWMRGASGRLLIKPIVKPEPKLVPVLAAAATADGNGQPVSHGQAVVDKA